MIPMDVECSKCGKLFRPVRPDVVVCPDCLKNEFSSARHLDSEEYKELVEQYRRGNKRQEERAAAMGRAYKTGEAFSSSGKVRFLLGMLMFVACAFIFMLIGVKNEMGSGVDGMDVESQRVIAMIVCAVAAVLVISSSSRRKMVVYPIALIMLGAGWFMPEVWQEERKVDMNEYMARQRAAAAGAADESSPGQPYLKDSDMQVYYQHKKMVPQLTHYGVFIDNQDSRTRSLMRDAFCRILEAEFTRAYTRANGALYVISNIPRRSQNLSAFLSRFGTVVYARPDDGVYEVKFDAEKANLISQYSPDVLTSPLNPSFVTANIKELSCIDPMRIRIAARSLSNANVQVLRPEIREALLKVLAEPWVSDQDTYKELIQALVTYTNPGDKVAVKHCLRYFENRRTLKKDVDPSITHYLIRESAKEMIAPVVDFWCENPIAWDAAMSQLGVRAQAALLAKLRPNASIRLIGSILNHLQRYGNAEAVPVVKKFVDHPDSIIRHTAGVTLEALQNPNGGSVD